uniref:BUD13 homolog n=1 Tax=Anopheles farauti TaxID=69004 RepID=A0A499FV15_9DIPT
MATKIDQKEYLKRYLSNDKDKKKKKKKDKKPTVKSNVTIIDDDLDLSKLQNLQEEELEQFALDEDAPQIAGIVDERPPELRAKEDFSSNKWKVLATNDEHETAIQVGDRTGRSAGFEMRTSKLPIERDRGARARKPDSENDASPPRRRRKDSDESPPRQRSKQEENANERRRRNDSSDESPPRKATGGRRSPDTRRARRTDSDESPPRKSERSAGAGRDHNREKRSEKHSKRHDYDPQRNHRHSDSDESPPRRSPRRQSERSADAVKQRDRDNRSEKRNKRYDANTSPQRQRRQNDSDASPPRRREENALQRRKQHRSDSDESPPRRSQRSETDRKRDDPASRTHRRAQDSDESPPRRNPRDMDRSDRSRRSPLARPSKRRDDGVRSPRRKQYETAGEGSSRRREGSPAVRIKQEKQDSDESPPRRRHERRPSRESHVRIKQEPRSSTERVSSTRHTVPERLTKTLDGKRAGLQDARSLREENEAHRQREREAFAKMSSELSGRYAETVVREKSGRRRDIEKELREELEKRKHDEKKKQIYDRWGKGVKQVEDYNAQLQEAAREMEKPLARYADDKDLDEYLKQQERDGDPMLEYLRSKRKEENKRAGIEERPIYQGAFPENRFGIRPGYRWDGVDRSNGFERRWFEMVSKKKATEEEAYKYSVEDM